jgi:hypothetical protein
MEVGMAVQVQVTWRVVGDDELEITSAFGQLVTIEGEGEEEASAVPIDRVLTPESSTVASGLALQIA